MEHQHLRKARGAYFTPPKLATYCVNWAIRSAADRVLEPSCGNAEFLISAADRLLSLGVPSSQISRQLVGVELHEESAAAARARLSDGGLAPEIVTGDFFEYVTEQHFDAVVGNPPYIRYQDFSGTARAKSLKAALALGVRLSGLASSWAAFVLQSATQLSEEGRLALVLPAELLSVGYAAEIRAFLLRRFRTLKLITFEERVFPGVLEDVVLLLAEGSGGAKYFELHQAKNASSLAEGTAAWTEHVPDRGAKWTAALVARDSFEIFEATKAKHFEALRDWGRTYLGAVTGNNRFFALPNDSVRALGLSKSDVIPISQPGSRHLRGVEITQAAWAAELASGAASYLFFPRNELSVESRRYIARGRDEGIDAGYKCRNRAPWWKVPLVDVPDLILTYMNHDRPRFVTNSADLHILNSVYGVLLTDKRRDIGRRLLPIASLNSVTLLGSEIVGRAYGGGLLKLEPREADMLPVPSLATVDKLQDKLELLIPRVGAALRRNDVKLATEIIDEVVLSGVSDEDLSRLRMAREILFERRKARGASV